MVQAAQGRGLGVLVRLTEQRAGKMCGPISQPGEYAVEWRASDGDRKKRSYAAGAGVTGRFLAARIGKGKSKEWLYLFTTREGDWQDLVEEYRRRGGIETDLRSLTPDRHKRLQPGSGGVMPGGAPERIEPASAQLHRGSERPMCLGKARTH